VTYFSILGSPQYFRNGESYKLPKVVNGDEGNLRAKPASWSRSRDIVAWGGNRGSGDLSPDTKHLHTRQSILLTILFDNVLKML